MVHRDSPDNNPCTPFEFTEANMTRICALIRNYPEGCERSALFAALDIVQRQMGWVPISAMHKVAELLNIPRMRVYEWATFYTMYKRRFRGMYNVKVCVTTPCMILGSDIILQAVEQATCCSAGGLSPDRMFGVDTVQCAGACVNAPVIIIDDDYYEDVTVCDVHNIITTLKAGGIPPCGPQSGRCASEPITGLTSLCSYPPPPGYCVQPSLCPGPSQPPCQPPPPVPCPPPPPALCPPPPPPPPPATCESPPPPCPPPPSPPPPCPPPPPKCESPTTPCPPPPCPPPPPKCETPAPTCDPPATKK